MGTLTAATLGRISVPTLVAWGNASRRGKDLLGRYVDATRVTIAGASHFAIATHAEAVARLILAHVRQAEDRSRWAP